MRVNEDYERWNAHNQTGDDNSVLSFWKRLLALRKGNTGLVCATNLIDR
jgi:oligo-1,6-glucosidase